MDMPVRRLTTLVALLASAAVFPVASPAQRAPRSGLVPAARAVYVDRAGVIRWKDDRSEVALFGANYAIMSASDYRAPGYLGLDRKRMIDDDMAHFARMGWNGLRLATWGDWENADTLGNLLQNDHLDLMDYLVARARERGLYMLLTPIQTYDAGWPDSLQAAQRDPGFSRKYRRDELGTNPRAIAAQVNYLRQLMSHVNPYTGVAYKDEPAILFVEMINEPVHHPEDLAAATRYIDTLAAAVRSTGSKQILFHNLTQDFAIAPAIRASTVQGFTFGWYPTGLNSGHELEGSYLRSVDDYPPLRDSSLAGLARVVYEFDSADLRTGYMYPAMARVFRSVGAQFASMFAYDFLGTASRNLGWQTHHLNLAYSPRKAMSAVIAAEAMRRLPRGRSYGAYPQNTRFGDFRVSYDENLGELAAPDAFLYTGDTRTTPPDPRRLQRIAGVGSSPVVRYDGTGIYFLDRVREGVWRLEVYPDAEPVRDPFVMPNPGKLVTRAIARTWPMTVTLPDLGGTFTVERVSPGGTTADSIARAVGGRFTVTPGVWLLSAKGALPRSAWPATIGHLRFDEFHPPAPDTLPVQLELSAAPEYVAGAPMEIAARVVDTVPPDSVTLWLRAAGAGWFRRLPMRADRDGYGWRVTVPDSVAREGVYDYAVGVSRGGSFTLFPEGTHLRPWDWDYSGSRYWRTRVVPASAPLRLFVPDEDAARLAFTRIGDAGRQGIFRLVPSHATGATAFHLELPEAGRWTPEDYTASLVVKDRVTVRGAAMGNATAVAVRLRGVGARQTLHLALMEKDGTTWSAPLEVDSTWAERTIPLSAFRATRGVNLPLGFPGQWNYWVTPAAGRGGAGDALRAGDIERLQLSLRKADAGAFTAGSYGVEIESVTVQFR